MLATRCVFVKSCSSKLFFVRGISTSKINNFSNETGENYVQTSTLQDVQIPKILLHEYVFKNIDKWHSKIALECIETGRKYTYSDVHKKSRALAVFLRKKMGLNEGETVAFVSNNVPEYAIGLMACLIGGLKITTMNPIYTEEEMKRQLLDSRAKAVFTMGHIFPTISKAAFQIKDRRIPIVVIKQSQDESLPNGAIDFNELVNGETEISWKPASWEDVAMLPYSSGTTGMPKGVQLTHKSLVSNLCQWLSKEVGIYKESNSEHQDVIPCFLPMFHIYGSVVITFSVLSMGAKMITVPKFNSQILKKTLEDYKPSVLFTVPPIVLMLLNNPNITKGHIEGIRTVASSAAPLGAADVERFVEKSHGSIDFLQMYGMTEASPIILAQSTKNPKGIKIGGAGFLTPNTLSKIVDINDERNLGLGPLKSGELIIKGPQIMKGYLNNEQATKETIVDDGWLRTGDIAHYDEDGHYFITDRLKELIKVKGFQVAPAELEEILRDHPYVEDAAVIGIPHKDFGEVPKAFVVTKIDTKVTANNICEYVASKVAKYKQLEGGVVFLENIPKNPSGKILRRSLKAMSI